MIITETIASGTPNSLRTNMSQGTKPSAAKIIPGGYVATRNVTPEIKRFCLEVKDELEAKVDRTFEIYEPKQYMSQVVAGANYIVKIEVGIDGECVHVLLFQPLPHDKPKDRNVLLERYKTGFKLDDPLEPNF